MNDWSEPLQPGKAQERKEGKSKEQNEGTLWKVRAYSFPASQICFHSFSSSSTGRQNHKESQSTDNYWGRMISIKGIEVVGFFCSVILTWKLGNMFETKETRWGERASLFGRNKHIYMF